MIQKINKKSNIIENNIPNDIKININIVVFFFFGFFDIFLKFINYWRKIID